MKTEFLMNQCILYVWKKAEPPLLVLMNQGKRKNGEKKEERAEK